MRQLWLKRGGGIFFLEIQDRGRALFHGYAVITRYFPMMAPLSVPGMVFPSPFHQQDSLNGLEDATITSGVPIVSFCFLVKDDETFFEEISRKKAFSMILTRHIHFFQHLSTSAKLKLFDLFSGACDNISLRYFHFSKENNIGSYLT